MQKGQKSAFEVTLLARYPYFLNQALEVSGEWKEFALDSDTEYIKEKGFLCHGDYQQHNIIRGNREFAVINFEKLVMDNPVRDICLYLRKVMEKTIGAWSWAKAFCMHMMWEIPCRRVPLWNYITGWRIR